MFCANPAPPHRRDRSVCALSLTDAEGPLSLTPPNLHPAERSEGRFHAACILAQSER